MTDQNNTDSESSQSSDQEPQTFFKYEPGTNYCGAEKFITEEFKEVNKLRDHNEKNKDFIGLALSGGGIRSATFSLGVLQALAKNNQPEAKKNWLEKVDYLSTVSGGGYIGSALTWLLRKPWGLPEKKKKKESPVVKNEFYNQCLQIYQKLKDLFKKDPRQVQFDCSPEQFPFNGNEILKDTDGKEVENEKEVEKGKLYKLAILAFLRQHGKYLAPGNGITLLSFLAALLRGTLVSLIIFIPLTALAFYAALQKFKMPVAYPMVPTGILDTFAGTFPLFGHMNAPFQMACLLILIFLFVVIIYAIGSILPFLPFLSIINKLRLYKLRRRYDEHVRWILGAIAFFVLIGCVILVHSLLRGHDLLSILSGLGSIIAGIIPFFMQFIKSSKSGQTKTGNPFITLLATGILLFGFLLLSYHLAQSQFLLNNPNWMWVGLTFVVILAYITQINYISIHRYYRDRLMEAYMPDVENIFNQKWASNLPAKEADGAKISEMAHENGPYHIINTNVITTDSTIPKFKGRGGDSFILSPYFCGSNATGWAKTSSFMRDTMTLSTAMSISGAAVNPNTGVGGEGLTRNPLVSLVMRILNIRLGYWVPHPNRPWYLRIWPPNFIYPYLISKHKEGNNFLELSDGGHFENLGLYELFRRRIKTIIVCDGGADKDFTFEDLGNALEKARVDFGIKVSLDLEPLIPGNKKPGAKKNAPRTAQSGFAVGEITYPKIQTNPSEIEEVKGNLIFIKTTYVESFGYGCSYSKSLPKDVVAYKNLNPLFPDQPTSDQFFDEKQFEAYRILGREIGEDMINTIRTESKWKDINDRFE